MHPRTRVASGDVLLSASGLSTNEIMRQTANSKTCVWRWQERFMEEGLDGLLRDKTRPSRIAPLGREVAERVVALTQSDPPGETTHWTGRHDGKGCRHQRQLRPADMARARPSATQGRAVQALHRSQVCRQIATMWSVSMSTSRLTPLSCPSMRRAKSRHLTAPSPASP